MKIVGKCLCVPQVSCVWTGPTTTSLLSTISWPPFQWEDTCGSALRDERTTWVFVLHSAFSSRGVLWSRSAWMSIYSVKPSGWWGRCELGQWGRRLESMTVMSFRLPQDWPFSPVTLGAVTSPKRWCLFIPSACASLNSWCFVWQEWGKSDPVFPWLTRCVNCMWVSEPSVSVLKMSRCFPGVALNLS